MSFTHVVRISMLLSAPDLDNPANFPNLFLQWISAASVLLEAEVE